MFLKLNSNFDGLRPPYSTDSGNEHVRKYADYVYLYIHLLSAKQQHVKYIKFICNI